MTEPARDVGSGGKVDHSVVSRHRRKDCDRVGCVATNERETRHVRPRLEPVRFGVREVVIHRHLAALDQQRADDLSADEPGAAGDECPGW